MKQLSPPVSSSSGPGSSDLVSVQAGPGVSGDSVSLAALVASRRAELGLSLRALGKRSGVHYSHLSKVEHGADSAGIGALAGLSRGLELPLPELLRAAGIEANLGLPSFSAYLSVAAPELGALQRRELEAVFEQVTGLPAATVPPTSGAPDGSPPSGGTS